ncbi:MAG: sigma factor-like helix-turn-helix DNA-binding protein [Oscillospiraceae bacterium]
MNLRVLKSKEILYPRNLFMDITDINPTEEQLEGLLCAVEKLGESERELIELRYAKKLSVARVAERLGKERTLALNEINEVLNRLSSPMLFNYIKYGKKKWQKIASLNPAERMKRISDIEGKPAAELDASYLELPRSILLALKRSHSMTPPYTVGDAAQIVFGSPQSRLITESDRKIAAELLAVCDIAVQAQPRRRTRHSSRKSGMGYPQNLYRCIFGASCPEPDSDMLKGLALALEEIPEPGRQVIILLYEKSEPYKEIALQLSLPLELVRQHEIRALRYLRRSKVRRMLRYGAKRSSRLEKLKGNPEAALCEPLERIMTSAAAGEFSQIGVNTLADAKNIDLSERSVLAAYELNDITAYLEI